MGREKQDARNNVKKARSGEVAGDRPVWEGLETWVVNVGKGGLIKRGHLPRISPGRTAGPEYKILRDKS